MYVVPTAGEELRDLDFMPDSLMQPSSDKMAFIARLANSITKRKRSTPQQFVGEHHTRIWKGSKKAGRIIYDRVCTVGADYIVLLSGGSYSCSIQSA